MIFVDDSNPCKELLCDENTEPDEFKGVVCVFVASPSDVNGMRLEKSDGSVAEAGSPSRSARCKALWVSPKLEGAMDLVSSIRRERKYSRTTMHRLGFN